MNNKKNVIVMFLFVMLSFAIISQVSAVSNAEVDGTGFDPSMKTTKINHDIASESDNDKIMQNHDEKSFNDKNSHNEQNSFDRSPQFKGDKNIEDKNLYGHDVNITKENQRPFNSSKANDFKGEHMDKPIQNSTDYKFNASKDLRNNKFPVVPKGEAVKNVTSKSKDLGKMLPQPKDDKNLSGKNMSKVNPKQISKNTIPIKNNSNKTPVLTKNIKNTKTNTKATKVVKKVTKNVKPAKKVNLVKKVNSLKNVKKLNRHLTKKANKGLAKL